MGKGIHAGGGCQALGQAVHQFGVYNGHGRDVVGIHAYHLCLTLLVDNYIINSHLGTCASGGGQGDDGHTLVFGGGNAFERHDVGKLRVVGHDADTFGGVHARSASDGNQAVGSAGLEGLYALLHIGDSGVGLDFAVYLVGERCLVEHISHHLGGTHLYQTFVRGHQRLLQAHAVQHFRQFLAGSGSEVGHFVQNKSLCHVWFK